MPLAVTHVLIPIILADIYRDYISKTKINLHYIFIAGIAGLLPDIDVVIFWFTSLFRDISLSEIHRTFTHTLFFPLVFLILFFLSRNVNFEFLKKYRLRLDYVLLAIVFGIIIHLILDGILSGKIMPFYPFSFYTIGLDLIPGEKFGGTFFTGIDAILLVIWLIHEEINHKISDYI